MSAAQLDAIDISALVPDGIEPIEMFRTWKFDGDVLRSVNTGNYAWEPGKSLHAKCAASGGAQYEWVLVRYGMSLENARAHAENHNRIQAGWSSIPYAGYSYRYINTPVVEPPDGYGYELRAIVHEAPSEDCSCGIYAGTSVKDCPDSDVYGKVKMWGKVVPGESGARAEYAYPSELHVPAKWADNPALLAYGVPIIVERRVEALAKRRKPSPVMLAIGFNVGAAVVNCGLIGAHLL